MARLVYNRRKSNPQTLLQTLPKHFNQATTLYVEGVNITADVEEVLLRYSDGKEYDLLRQNFASKAFRCLFSADLLRELALLSARHAEPEMMDHMFVYAGTTPLLTWCDAFWGEIEIDPSVSEEAIIAFASENNLKIDDLA